MPERIKIVRRKDRTGRQDCLARSYPHTGSRRFSRQSADDLVVFDEELQQRQLRSDFQIGPRAHQARQVGHAGRRTHLIRSADRQDAMAVPEVGIHILDLVHAVANSDVTDRASQWRPGWPRQTANLDRSGIAMKVAGEVKVCFDPSKVRQNVREGPTRCASTRPVVIISRIAANRPHPHD